MNYRNISLWFTNRDYKTGQPCYDTVWAYFTSRDDMQLNLKSLNPIHGKVWDDNTCPFPNFNGATVEVWEWISNFIPHFTRHLITYPCWD